MVSLFLIHPLHSSCGHLHFPIELLDTRCDAGQQVDLNDFLCVDTVKLLWFLFVVLNSSERNEN